MYKFFVGEQQINNDRITIIEDVNHIKNVLRLNIEDKIQICNIHNGVNYVCKIIELNNKNIICDSLEKLDSNNEPSIYIHIFQGMPKAEKLEQVIQKATEIGVCEITPIQMNRCVVKIDEKTEEKKMQRWMKIAEVAAKQSKRDRTTKINNIINIKNIYEKLKNYDIVIVAYENEKDITLKHVLSKINRKPNMKIAVIIGPEGGIEEYEVEDLKNNGAKVVTLGKTILRTETAPLVISSIILYELEN